MADSDDDFDLDGALEQSLAAMEQNDDDDAEINIASQDNDENESKQQQQQNENNLNSAQDDKIMQDALNAVQQSINNADQSNNDMMNDGEMKDFFNEIFKSFSNLEDDADDESLDRALKKVMQQFFDSNQLKEPVQIICNKYPQWLEENKATLTAKEYENYTAQYKLYSEANVLLSTNKPDTSKIMDILLKTFSYGSLPPAVMDGMMPDELKQFADQMANFEKTMDNEAKEQGDSGNGDKNNEDMNGQEAMKFFQQLMGMQNPENANGDNNAKENNNKDDQKDGDFMPDLNDLPKLNEAEMKQFKQLMNQDGCLIM